MIMKKLKAALVIGLVCFAFPVFAQLDFDSNGAYHNYAETAAILQELAGRYPDLAQLVSIGRSAEGRELFLMKISGHAAAEEAEPNIYIVGGTHAREWISVEVPLLLARQLLENYAGDAAVRRLVDGAQIYIMPLLNPDGLEFSIHTYRWWRKNRRYNGNFSWGVDLNRNWGFQWGHDDQGSSPDPNGEAFRGNGPFSEPETDALRLFMQGHPPTGAIFYHNYGQKILYPWEYTNEPAPDKTEMAAIAAEMNRRMASVSGRIYISGGMEILYPTNGGACDWVYGTFAAPAFTIELPNASYLHGGFFTAENEIMLTFAENLPALLYFLDYFLAEK
jgi:carboxypeptidase T